MFSGVIIDPPTSENDVYGTTVGTFYYDILNDKFTYNFHNFDASIAAFYETDKFIFYIEVKGDGNAYKWSLIKSNKDYTNKEKLFEGTYTFDICQPSFLIDEITGKVFLYYVYEKVTIADMDLIYQNYKFYELLDNKFYEIMKGSYNNTKTDNSEYIINSWNIKIKDNNIYYATSTLEGIEKIYQYNINDKSKKEVYDLKKLTITCLLSIYLKIRP